ncbi:methylated-DNA--[protein]-cysteine S-methyltransferase [Cellulomonas endophytica]|uniref:methylated-DNA--[protein]-cysteine S-methyltransferase n=1 Tax=Cellulomonas endophytica TaxID=2494735 RepID=UPI00101247F3|nr:methylated-DNA--[protein]-cysteine S-methyltransferase [Cellulomonas endophytica]
MSHLVVDSPVGPLTLVAGDEGPTAGHLVGVYMVDHRPAPDRTRFGTRLAGPGTGSVLDEAARQLDAWFAGRRRDFDLPTAAAGTDFQREVWAGLAQIPYGTTWSYGRLATHIGRPAAVRAVGMANGRNPLSIVVPCHRVVGSDGSLTGYAGGPGRKRHLLDLEAGRATLVPAG